MWLSIFKKKPEPEPEPVVPPNAFVSELMERKRQVLAEKRHREELAKNALRHLVLESLKEYPASAVYIEHLSYSIKPDWVIEELNKEFRQMGFKVDSYGRIEVP